jgi:hypothetical protein
MWQIALGAALILSSFPVPAFIVRFFDEHVGLPSVYSEWYSFVNLMVLWFVVCWFAGQAALGFFVILDAVSR